jgi:D-beta-D-heptose 7-phosphate kinase / D-beta-D-heptose 1-phosphate adenosyltransferase
MSSDILQLIERFCDLRAIVLGEAMLDVYLRGSSTRLAQEAPVPVVDVVHREDFPGGAANAAANLRSLGAHVDILSAIGKDGDGELLSSALLACGVPADGLIASPSRATLAKQRVLADDQVLVRFDTGTTTQIDAHTEQSLIHRLVELWDQTDVVVISDYGYGAVPPAIIDQVGRLHAASPRTIVVDAKDLSAYAGIGVTAIKPNYKQVLRMLSAEPLNSSSRVEIIMEQGVELLDKTGARVGAVTIDLEGAVIFERGRPPYRTYAKPQKASSTAGAGDTFTAAFALALGAGADSALAAECASAAAAVSVSKACTSTCTRRELNEYLIGADKLIDSPAGLAASVEWHRALGHRVVLTNGCFDILHRGHVTYLSRAKALGDVLIVGVNTDEGVRRLKGADRPVNSLDDRVGVLSGLSCVDHVVAFGEDTPEALVRAIKPDVFVKGGDYTVAMLPEAKAVEESGGTVLILPYVQDRSTSGLIKRIRSSVPGSHEDVASP